MNSEGPQTLIDAVKHFADPQICHEYMVNLKWPDGKITCPKCGGENIGNIASRSMMQCKAKECRKQFSTKVGTIFEDSPLPLSKWLAAVWMVANCKNGISSCEMARALGVTQKTAWFMDHRIRLAMETKTFRKLDGVVESDETYIGGKAENMHAAKREKVIKGRGGVGKVIIHGLLERGNVEDASKVMATVVPNTEQVTLIGEILRKVDADAYLCTDSSLSYANLASRYIHAMVDHSVQYVRGKVHTNSIENFWSLLKRTIRGTYVAVAPFHLQRYLDEQAWRFNFRKLNDGRRFNAVMPGVIGKRITYRQLCAIGDCGFMGIE